MKNTPFILAMLWLLGCGQPDAGTYSATEYTDPHNVTPTVQLSKYTVVAKVGQDRKKDAEEILRVKRRWPLAMQSLDIKEFDAILGKDFTFKSHDEFFTRADYIRNRTTPGDWKITFVEYDNVSLQFIGTLAILSYRNHVRNENSITKEIETERIAWVDIYVKEKGAWKIGSAYAVDYSVEQ